MKAAAAENTRWWLTVSVSLNVILCAGMVRVIVRTPPPLDSSRQVPGVAVAQPESAQRTEPDGASPVRPHPETPVSVAQWVAMLKAADAPVSVLAAVVQADFDQRWRMTEEQAQRRYADGQTDIQDLALLSLHGDAQLEAEMRVALGEDGFSEWDRPRQFQEVNVQALRLTTQEEDQLYRLRKGLNARFRELERAKLRRQIDQAAYDRDREQAQAAYEQSFRMLVGTERYHLVKEGGLPADIRQGLQALRVSESQLEALQTLENEHGERHADLEAQAEHGAIDSLELARQAAALREWRDQQIQLTLGPEAFDYVQKQEDSRYLELRAYAAEWSISEAEVEHVYRALRQYDQAAQAARLHVGGPTPQNESAERPSAEATLKKLAHQTTAALEEYLGSPRTDLLRRNRILPGN